MSHTPRLPQKQDLHPCPLCYQPMHNMTCEKHGEMEWCQWHKAAYLPDSHECSLRPAPSPRIPKPKKKRKWKNKYVPKYPKPECIICGAPVRRGKVDAPHFCGKHRARWQSRFRYWTRRRQRETGLPNMTEEEAIRMMREATNA